MRCWIAAVALCGLAGAAHADHADQLFKQGQKLLAEKRYAEACKAFVDSDRFDPQIGVKLNAGRCYQEWGRLATAWRWYTDAEQMASKAGDKRTPQIHALIEGLERDVPHLTLVLPPDAATDHLAIRLDGVPLALATVGDDRRVDPGLHEITILVDGQPRVRMIQVLRGDRSRIPLDVPTPGRARAQAQRTSSESAADARRTRRLIGLGTAGAGVIAVGIAGITTLRAHSDYEHALHGYCNDAPDMCDPTGLSRTHSARHRANIATVVTLLGTAAVAGGLYLYYTTPQTAEHPDRSSRALYLAPAIGGDGAGVVLGGAF